MLRRTCMHYAVYQQTVSLKPPPDTPESSIDCRAAAVNGDSYRTLNEPNRNITETCISRYPCLIKIPVKPQGPAAENGDHQALQPFSPLAFSLGVLLRAWAVSCACRPFLPGKLNLQNSTNLKTTKFGRLSMGSSVLGFGVTV